MSKIFRWAAAHGKLLGAILFWSATLLWMACIFNMSAQNAAQSTGTSGGTIRWLAPLLHKNFATLDPIAQEEIIESLQDSVRTVAHLVEYGVLGGLLLLASKCTFSGKYTPIIITAATGMLFALSDEVHQIFVPGRAYEFTDLLIDWAGLIMGLLAALLLILIVKPKKKRSVQK